MQLITISELPEQLKALVGSIRNIEYPARQGYTSQVMIIESAAGKFVVKCSSGRFFSWLEHESLVLQALSGTALLVPRFRGHCVTKTDNIRKNWLLMDFVAGIPIRAALEQADDTGKRAKICYNFGRVLAQIHATNVDLAGVPLETDWLKARLAEAKFSLKNGLLPDYATPKLLTYLQENQPIAPIHKFIHGDFTVDNTLCHNGEITGVIDWSLGNWGDPRYDTALALRPDPLVFDRRSDREAFFSGYGEISLSPEVHKYFLKLYCFF